MLCSIATTAFAAETQAPPAPFTTPAPPPGATEPATADKPEDAVPQLEIELVVDNSGRPNSDGTVTGSLVLTNNADDPVAVGSVEIAAPAEPFADTRAYTEWISGDGSRGTVLVTTPAPRVDAQSSTVVEFEITTDQLPLSATDQFGVYGLDVQWEADGSDAANRSALVVGELTDSAISLTPVVPIVAPLGETTLLTADELQELTGRNGALTQLLDGVEGHDVTLAVDPRLIASIRSLGDDAPNSAIAWLNRLEELNLPSLELEFADANLALQAAAGLDEPLTPNGFQFVARDRSFPDPEAEPEPGPSSTPAGTDGEPSSSPTPSPSAKPTPNTPVKPDDPAELQRFDYTEPNVTYLSQHGLDYPNFRTVAQWREDDRFLIDGNRLENRKMCRSQVRVDGRATLVTNSVFNSAFAASTDTADASMAATTRADTLARLMLLAQESGSDCDLITALPRHDLADGEALDELLTASEQVGAVELAELPEPVDAAALPVGKLDELPLADATIKRFTASTELEPLGVELRHLYDDPAATEQQLRAELIRLSSTAWSTEPRSWRSARANYAEFAIGARKRIRIISGSEVQLIGHELTLPVFIENTSNRRVTVRVTLRPSTGHIEATEPQTIVVEPHSNARAQLPVTAVANGPTQVDVWLETHDSVKLPATARLKVNVNAEIETVLGWMLIGGAILLVVLGTYRTIRRRRRAAGRAELRNKMEAAKRNRQPASAETTDTDTEAEQ